MTKKASVIIALIKDIFLTITIFLVVNYLPLSGTISVITRSCAAIYLIALIIYYMAIFAVLDLEKKKEKMFTRVLEKMNGVEEKKTTE